MSASATTESPRGATLRRDELTLHGHTVSYITAGSGPVILLIHGIAGRAEQWAPLIECLSERFTVVAPDLLGHGRSAKPPESRILYRHMLPSPDFFPHSAQNVAATGRPIEDVMGEYFPRAAYCTPQEFDQNKCGL